MVLFLVILKNSGVGAIFRDMKGNKIIAVNMLENGVNDIEALTA